jgi:hypothetical protein
VESCDPQVRQFCICKIGYSQYCAKCDYKVYSEWAKKQGFEHGWIFVVCCEENCPNGVAYGIKRGQSLDFDPELSRSEQFIYVPQPILVPQTILTEEVKPEKEEPKKDKNQRTLG